jgi:D-alanyl-D-alanine carboxypeptidase
VPGIGRRRARRRLATGIIGLGVAALIGPGAAAAAPCPPDELATAAGCSNHAEAGAAVEDIVDRAMAEDELRAALVRIEIGEVQVAAIARGESMPGKPATPRMHFRIGSMAIPHLITLLLQLQDNGRLSLDDPIANWLPNAPNAEQVTLRMLANSTSGYPDWAQRNPQWGDLLTENPFREWTQAELLRIAFDQPLECDPGTCFRYAHTNFLLLQKVIERETGKPVARLIRAKVLRPLGLRHTKISADPAIPGPVLHAYYGGRGVYEDSTYWSPSWTIGHDTVMTGTIGDITRAARAIGTGKLLSPAASRLRFADGTTGLSPLFTDGSFYYGLGILLMNGWQFQNPNLTGFTGIQGYFPGRDISVGLTVANGPEAAEAGINYSQRLFNDITAYLTPGNEVTYEG